MALYSNRGKPWTAIDTRDLLGCLEDRQSLALGRTQAELAARITESWDASGRRSDRAQPGPEDQLTDEEREAVITALRQLIERDRYPQAPRLAPFKSALAKLTGVPASPPAIELTPLPAGPQVGRNRRGGRR